MNDAALLDSLHAALRNPDLAWYTEFHAGESIVAGYLDSLTDPYDDDAIQVPEGWFRYSVVTREGEDARTIFKDRPLTDDCLFANSIWPEPELLGLVDDLTGRTGRNL